MSKSHQNVQNSDFQGQISMSKMIRIFLFFSWVLPRKVAKMVWISVQFSFIEYDGCFLLSMYQQQQKEEPKKHPYYLLMAGNFHQIGYFSRKHPWVLPECFLSASFCDIMVYGILGIYNFGRVSLSLFSVINKAFWPRHVQTEIFCQNGKISARQHSIQKYGL